jgi:hypothetical protein
VAAEAFVGEYGILIFRLLMALLRPHDRFNPIPLRSVAPWLWFFPSASPAPAFRSPYRVEPGLPVHVLGKELQEAFRRPGKSGDLDDLGKVATLLQRRVVGELVRRVSPGPETEG